MKSTLRLALAAAVAQDIAGFTADFTLILDGGVALEETADGALLLQAFLVLTTDAEVGLLVDDLEVFKADDIVILDDVDDEDVQ